MTTCNTQSIPGNSHRAGAPCSRRFIALTWGFALATLAATPAIAQTKPTVKTAEPGYFQYQSPVSVEKGAGTAACALLTPAVFAHAAPSLTDLRLYSGGQEVPYAETLSQPSAPGSESARILNLGLRGGHIVFDLEMPDRPYTEVNLDLAGKDFLATAKVSGSAAPGGSPATDLGQFALFDLTGQHLSRSATLNLQETTFRYLHVDLAVSPANGGTLPVTPAMVRGAEIPPSREAQTLYTTIASATPVVDAAEHREEATFHIDAHVPVERVRFTLAPGFKANFSRPVRIWATPDGAPATNGRPLEEALVGEISRVDIARGLSPIHELQLTVPATLGANMQTGATIHVAVEDGDDRPLQLASVVLEMRERKLCFDAPAEPPTLFYGDPGLRAPVYDYARFFVPTATLRVARLGAESANPLFAPRPDERPFTDKHPDLLWVALLLVIGILAVVAFRSTRQMAHRR